MGYPPSGYPPARSDGGGGRCEQTENITFFRSTYAVGKRNFNLSTGASKLKIIMSDSKMTVNNDCYCTVKLTFRG